PLQGRRAAMLESHPLARQALLHQLEDCHLQVLEFTRLDQLLEQVAAQREHGQPIELAVLGVSLQELPPEQLAQHLWDLERLGCKALVLCPTTEQMLYHESLAQAHLQLQAKPACTRKLLRSLSELVSPRLLKAEAPAPLTSRAPRLLCVDDNPANLLLVQTLLSDMGAAGSAVDSGKIGSSSSRDGVSIHAVECIFGQS